MVAHRLNLDPADVRRRNLIRHEEMPYDLGKHPFHYMVYDTGDFCGQLEHALERIGYEKLKLACAEAKRAGRAMGVGIGCFVETSGIGPWEYARVEIDNTGQAVLYSGCNSVGQGIATALSQIVADELQVSIDNVRVVHGDTAQVPYGNGSNASRSTVMAGSAALGASRKVKQKILRIASTQLEIDPGDLDSRRWQRECPRRAGALPQLHGHRQAGASGHGAEKRHDARDFRRRLFRHRQKALSLWRPRRGGGSGQGDRCFENS